MNEDISLPLPWWLVDGVRPVPPAPLAIPGLDVEPGQTRPAAVPAEDAVPAGSAGREEPVDAVPEPGGFDRQAFVAALVEAGHRPDYANTTAARAHRVLTLLPGVMAELPAKDDPRLGKTPDGRKKALQAVRVAVGWIGGGGVPTPKPATGGRAHLTKAA